MICKPPGSLARPCLFPNAAISTPSSTSSLARATAQPGSIVDLSVKQSAIVEVGESGAFQEQRGGLWTTGEQCCIITAAATGVGRKVLHFLCPSGLKGALSISRLHHWYLSPSAPPLDFPLSYSLVGKA